jgi:hypothetical protein
VGIPEHETWIALQFDQAVVYFGNVIENALAERQTVGVGDGQRSEAKYTLAQLLRDDFRLPAPERATDRPAGRGVGALLKSMAGRGVKLWKGE